MTSSEAAAKTNEDTDPVAKSSWREGLAVYLQPRVLIVLFLGFSSGLPLALSGSTLGVDAGSRG